MKTSPFGRRISAILHTMEEQQIDCLFVTPGSDMKYLCGYSIKGDERFLTLVLAPGHEPFILANILYELQVTETPIAQFTYWPDGDDPFALLSKELATRGIAPKVVAVDAGMPALFTLQLQEILPGVTFQNGSTLVQPLRIYKDQEEIQCMIDATAKADAALQTCIQKGTYWVGKTENDFLAELTLECNRLGVANVGACVAVGEGAAVPHHHTGETVISMGKCLLIDFGGTYRNYNTDMTRTFHFGEPSEKFREVYEIVKEANLAGEAAAKVGNQLQDVDFAAREVIEKAGFGPYFIHRTGHGIGIDCHEGPSAGAGETTLIQAGMAFSCEPGIYLPGEFGVRIEDQVAIDTKGNTLILHHFPKDLQIIKD